MAVTRSSLSGWRSGGATVAIFPSEPADTIRFMLQHSNAKLLFVGKLDNWDKRASVPDGMPCGGNAHIYFSESRGLGLDGARLAGSASAPIPADVIVWYRKLGLTLLEAYGMTEDFGYSHASSERFNAPGYVGMPYEGVEVRLSDDDPNARLRWKPNSRNCATKSIDRYRSVSDCTCWLH